jgi:hypothetical protein
LKGIEEEPKLELSPTAIKALSDLGMMEGTERN